MPAAIALGDLNLSAYMSSKICHDLVGPVGAIYNGLELLEEEDDEKTRAYAMELIQDSARIARARLEFSRLAFGASAGLGGELELGHAEKVARPFIEEGKHKLYWHKPQGAYPKDRVRLVLITLCISLLAVPGGGEIAVAVAEVGGDPAFQIRCRGKAARVPENAQALFDGAAGGVEPRTILPYYAGRLADDQGLRLTVRQGGQEIIFAAIRAA